MGDVVSISPIWKFHDDLTELVLEGLHQRHLAKVQHARAHVSLVELVVVKKEMDHYVDAGGLPPTPLDPPSMLRMGSSELFKVHKQLGPLPRIE